MDDVNFDSKMTSLKDPGARNSLLQVVPDFEKIEGWLKLADCELLFAAAASVRSGCIVEVGSFRGRSTASLCAGAVAGSKVPVYAIEPHEHFVGVKGGVFGPSDRRAFFKTMLSTRFAAIVRLINTTSQVVAPGWDKPVSLLFIDGDHRYEAVLADFTAWRPHLVHMALVIFNDASGTGTGLLIKDLVAEGALTHVQTVGRLALFRFAVVEGLVDKDLITGPRATPVYPAMPVVGGAGGASTSSTIYSVKGDCLYQPIPKCGASLVRPILAALEEHPADLRAAWDGLNAEQKENILAGRTETFKFAMVRDPYARLASVYADKIAGSYARGEAGWVTQIRDAAAAYEIELGETISFPDFVRVVAAQSVDEMDEQWRPQYVIGQFDRIKYDFIGRVEMFATDFAYVMEMIGAPAALMHRAEPPANRFDSGFALWSLVKPEIRAEFLKTFAADFDALRYPMRYSSVKFAKVNVDRPQLSPFWTLDRKLAKIGRARRKVRRAVGVAASGDGADGDSVPADE